MQQAAAEEKLQPIYKKMDYSNLNTGFLTHYNILWYLYTVRYGSVLLQYGNVPYGTVPYWKATVNIYNGLVI
jgi:hypothetical protein